MKASISDDYVNLTTVTESLHKRDRITSCESNVYESPVVSASKSPLPGVPLTTKAKLATVSAVCLGLLCVLLLAGIIGLWFYHTEEQNKWDKRLFDLQTSNNNLTQDKDQLQASYNNLTKKNDQLQTSYNNLTKMLQEMENSPRWYKLGFSWYYNSNESKTWTQSRQDCLSRGADLVIINSRDEEAFIVSLFNKRMWIGLTDIEVKKTWKWVDGTFLNTSLSFWSPSQPDNGGATSVREDCVEIYKPEGTVLGWNDRLCGNNNSWICEKYISNQHV